MPKLTDTQFVILSAAAQRDDGAAVPLPKSLKADDKAKSAALKRLLKTGLLAEQPATRDGAVWREHKDGQRLTLAVTDAGRKALGDESSAQDEVAEPAAKPTRKQANATKAPLKSKAGKPTAKVAKPHKGKTAAPAVGRQGTKQQVLIDLLRRPGGATIEQAVKATGWQPHSVRGAISGALKKKLGLDVTSVKVEGRGRVYRISGDR